MSFKIGIDLGGTKTEAILLDHDFNIIKRTRVPTISNNYNDIINTISSLILEISIGVADYTLGVCAPGTISKRTGLVKNSNTQCLIDKPLKNDLETKLNRKIRIENDANCFALAESKLGVAVGYNVVFGVIMGTGVGGGIIINGEMCLGRNGIAGEWGHHVINNNNGIACYCGKSGCVETVISGPSLENRWMQLTGKSTRLPDIIFNYVDNEISHKWKQEFLENFGRGLANVINVLDPDVIVLGGGLSNIGFLYTEGIKHVHDNVFSDYIDTPILKNKLGDSAGVIGACLLSN